MKKISLVIVICASLLTHNAGADYQPGFRGPRRGEDVRRGPHMQTVSVFLKANGSDQLPTRSDWEGEHLGFRTVAMITLAASAVPGLVPLYRCYRRGKNHFVSQVENCEGQISEGLLGYAGSPASPRGPFRNPLYRCFGNGTHLVVSDYSVCTSQGMRVEALLGYSLD